ncbi:hypothetical protein L837_0753 [Mycobacterium avium MAV_061107_1842]|nr:hypothetical protein L837_0753 [Mycobacterium avium MAV_061107_1842]
MIGVLGAHGGAFSRSEEVGRKKSEEESGWQPSAATHARARSSLPMNRVNAHHVSLSAQGPVMADPRLPDSRLWWLLNLVITRGTPPRLEGCRPASRGLMLALMTDTKTILLCRPGANSPVATRR